MVVARQQDRALPPFEFITDRDRLLGLVFEPLCPPSPAQRPLQLPVPAVADCSVQQGYVRVVVRTGVRWQEQQLQATRLRSLLDEHAARRAERLGAASPQWDRVEVLDDRELHVRLTSPTASAEGLRFVLSELYLAAEHEQCRIGTGAWVEDRCTEGDFAYKRSLLPAALRNSTQVTDIALLERKDQLFRHRRVLVVGWDFEATAGQEHAALVTPLGRALQAGEGDRVHLIRGLEAPEILALRKELPAADAQWSMISRRGDRSAWLVTRPTLSREVRLKLLDAARGVLQSPDYFDEASGSPVRSLLPEVYPPLVFSGSTDDSSDCEAADAGTGADKYESSPFTLLTHTRLGSMAEDLRRLWTDDLNATGQSSALQIEVRNAKDEAAQRRSSRYDLSLQSPVALDSSHPSRIFADNLTAWFPANHPLVQRAHLIADLEAKHPESATAALKSLMRCLNSYMLPISSPPSWVVVHKDLRGWNAAADWLDPTDVGLRSYGFRGTEWLGVGLLVLALPLYGLRRRQRVERARNAAEIASFHHDLSSPLASVRAEAEYLREDLAAELATVSDRLRDSADFIDQQTSHVIDLVDNLRAVSGPEGWLVRQDLDCDLAPLMKSELEALQRRAVRERIGLIIEESCAAERVALPASIVRRVLRNLLDNAYKYRRPNVDAVRIRILTSMDSEVLVVDVEDDGMGFEDFPVAQHFRPRQRGRLAREHQLPGQGLGLSSTQRLLAAQGASIEIHHLGKPTRVRLRLPLAYRSTK